LGWTFTNCVFFIHNNLNKVATWYTPYELFYESHPLMPTKYVMSTFSGDHMDANHVKVFTNRLTKLKKLLNDKLQVEDTIENQ
jgi:hypothetical protein